MKYWGRMLSVIAVMGAGAAWAVTGGGEIQFKIADMESVTFSHELHVTSMKLKCSECHYKTYTTRARHTPVTMAEMRKGKSCGLCHNGQRAFSVNKDCKKCHSEMNH